jgi:proteasome lid subunit RPN8/RPN11
MRISSELLGEIVAHAQEDPAVECCGVVAVAPGSPAQAMRVHRALNKHNSALKFEIDGTELVKLYNEIDGDGYELGGIYHSHVRSAPYPSQTDINFAAKWPGVEWIIIGLAAGREPEARSYLIDGDQVKEVSLQVS